MSNIYWPSIAATATLLALSGTASAQSSPPPPSPPPATEQQPLPADEEIVVTGTRLPGSLPGDAKPEITLNPVEIRSYGTSSVAELIGAISPQTGTSSGRGGGAPVILVNGRRISGFQEIRDLPTEAIARVEIFSEQVAVQFGFSPDQRVINLVLRRRFQVNTADLSFGQAAEGGRGIVNGAASRVVFDRSDRLTFSGGYDRATAILEREAGIRPPDSGPDQRSARTVAPETANAFTSGLLSRALTDQSAYTVSLRGEAGETSTLLGVDAISGRQIARTFSTTSLRAAASLDGNTAGWQWTTNAVVNFASQDSETSGGQGARQTFADTASFELNANANGPSISLPAGVVRLNGRIGLDARTTETGSQSATGFVGGDLDRTAWSSRFGFAAPLTSRRSGFGAELGDVSVNATVTLEDISDFGGLSGWGGGFNWSPDPQFRISAQYERSKGAPSLQQLGDPVQVTPSVSVFDVARNETVVITRIGGGSPDLAGESRQDLTINVFWAPEFLSGLTLTGGWSRNRTDDAIAGLPLQVLGAEAAFPARFTRNASGQLTSIDVRPVNLARRDRETLRWGFDFSQTFGTPARPPEGAPPWGNGLPPWGSGPPPWGSGPPPWQRGGGGGGGGQSPGAGPPIGGGGGPGGGGGRGGPPPGGRWNLTVTHVLRLDDTIILRAGAPTIDLLDSGGLSGEPASENSVEFEGGVVYRGLGLRMSGTWASARRIRAVGGDLDVSETWILSARAFVNFDQQHDLLASAPWLSGGRLSIGLQNLTDSTPDVTDASGQTPYPYQAGFLTPQGRVIAISFRKQF
jgi:hypothetical protein